VAYEVTGPDGQPAPPVHESRQIAESARSYQYPALEPGKSVQITAVDLDQYFYVRKIGKYRVRWKGSKARPADEIAAVKRAMADELVTPAPILAEDIPPTAFVEFEMVPSPGGGPDGNLVGRLLAILPPGWIVNGNQLLMEQKDASGSPHGRSSSIILSYYSMPGWLSAHKSDIHVVVSDLPEDPGENQPSALLGRGPLGYVYLVPTDYRAAPVWNHYAYDIAVALEVNDPKPTAPEGQDWGRMVAAIIADCSKEESLQKAAIKAKPNAEKEKGLFTSMHFEDNILIENSLWLPHRLDPKRPCYLVNLDVTPDTTGIQIEPEAADRSIKWDGKTIWRAYDIKRLGIMLSIVVSSDDEAFAKTMNAIIDREVTKTLREAK
jgi:hypothetical protein